MDKYKDCGFRMTEQIAFQTHSSDFIFRVYFYDILFQKIVNTLTKRTAFVHAFLPASDKIKKSFL